MKLKSNNISENILRSELKLLFLFVLSVVVNIILLLDEM